MYDLEDNLLPGEVITDRLCPICGNKLRTLYGDFLTCNCPAPSPESFDVMLRSAMEKTKTERPRHEAKKDKDANWRDYFLGGLFLILAWPFTLAVAAFIAVNILAEFLLTKQKVDQLKDAVVPWVIGGCILLLLFFVGGSILDGDPHYDPIYDTGRR